jgi:hypothetical protein
MVQVRKQKQAAKATAGTTAAVAAVVDFSVCFTTLEVRERLSLP